MCTDQTMYAVDIMRFHNFDMLNTYVEHSVHAVCRATRLVYKIALNS